MSEEIRNAGMELNDAALSGVSGGDDYAEYEAKAKEHCRVCDRISDCSPSGPRYRELATYIRDRGNPAKYSDCPFHSRAWRRNNG